MNKKLGLRMAQGGLIQGDERAALYAKYGIKPGGSTPTPQPPAPTPQAPAPVQKAQSGGLLDQARSALGGRRKQLEETMNYAEGGIVRGKGGPTDDEVPMQVAGKNVNLSNTEAVLPAKTVQALGGPKAVEALIELTNGKPPVRGGLREGGAYYTGTSGDLIDPKELRPAFRGNAAGQPVTPASNPGAQAMQNSAAQAHMDKMAAADPARAAEAAKLNAQSAAAQPATSGRLEQPSRNPAPAATPPTEQTKWGKVKSGAMTVGRGLNAVGAVASGAADIATANEPAEQVTGALKMSAALPGWAGLPGKIALYGDEAVKGVTGKGVAQWLDKAAQAHPDYMLDKNREWGSAGTRADTTGPVGQAGGQTAPAAEGEGVKDFDTNLMNTLTAASRQNGGQVSFNSAKDATEYSPAAGTGVITRAPGKDGLRSATFVGGPSAGDAARDKQFAEAGYGKDSYGNWMTPGRIADQQKAAAIDARDAKIQAARDARDAENYKAMRQGNGSAMGDERMGLLRKVMTPHAGAQNGQLTAAQMNAARAIMGDAHSEQLKAQELAISGQNKQQELGLRAQESASLDAYRKGSLAQDAQKTAASARTAAQSNYLAASKEQRDMVKSYIEEMTPTAGLKDEKLEKQLQRRALMHEAFWKAGAGQLSLDPVELQGQLPMYTDVARGTVNKREAIMNPSLRDQLRNLFDGNKSREYTMNPTNTVTTEDGRVIYMPGGPGISADAVYQGNADLRDAQERINRQKAAQQ